MDTPIIEMPRGRPLSGTEVLASLLRTSRKVMKCLRPDRTCGALVGTVRGDGPGASFGAMIERLEADHPLQLASPFEGSEQIAAAAWRGDDLLGAGCADACIKLRWSAGADDLPMHTHTASDRVIFVLEGRGYFHVSGDEPERFHPGSVSTHAVRARDALAFTRGVVHTFSTGDEPMTLLSVHLPFLPLDDDAQYTLPERRWVARERLADRAGRVTVGRWTRLV